MLCQLLKKAKTDSQLVDFAYIIFQKSGLFMNALMHWNKRTTNTTYADFRKFIQEEYHALDAVGGLTVANSTFNQANAVQELKAHQEQLTEHLKEEFNANV